MGIREIFRENLKYYRKHIGLSQEKLSEMIGYGDTYITEIESRHKFPKPETIDLIAEKLGIEAYQLFQKLGCPANIKKNTKNDFIASLSDRLYTNLSQNLHDQITREITDVFKANV